MRQDNSEYLKNIFKSRDENELKKNLTKKWTEIINSLENNNTADKSEEENL